jgi:ATP-dependent helicase HrpB
VTTPALPIDADLPELLAALHAGPNAVLQAPPGAGKTTRVPLALLEAPWLVGQKIVMLEPRRLAARAAARYMARQLGDEVGGTVGFRVRGETRVSRRTRIEVVTEGVLTRMLQEDQSLEGVGAVLFDEYHERSIHADTGLALCLQTQEVLRPQLRILVMSATLDGARIAALLGGAPVVTSDGRLHPVETRYRERSVSGWIEDAVAGTIRDALHEETGDVLVFLPGAGEIRRVQAQLRDVDATVTVHALFGMLPPAEQDAALAPAPRGRRKVVLATSIAETSLTIEGVRVVVDSGLARVPRFSARTGMSRLETTRVPLASADQRRGRAGRLGPGVCYRCWTVGEHAGLLPYARPELLEADLAPLALDLSLVGICDPAELRWLDAPPAAAFTQARALLCTLGALTDRGALTAHGKVMSRLGLHPRLAHLLVTARTLGLAPLAVDLAAVLDERDLLRGNGAPAEADLRLRLAAVRGRQVPGHSADPGAVHRVREQARDLSRRLRESEVVKSTTSLKTAEDGSESDSVVLQTTTSVGLLLALAYPDRVARRRDGYAGRYLLANGRGAWLQTSDLLAREDWLVVADLDDAGTEATIRLAAPIDLADIMQHLPIDTRDEIQFDPVARTVAARRRRMLGALVIDESPLREPDPAAIAGVLLAVVRREGLRVLEWSDQVEQLRARLAFVHALDGESWPEASDEALLASLETWLLPHLEGIRRIDALRKLDLRECLLGGLLDWKQRQQLDQLAPERIAVPIGSMVQVDYADPAAPVLAVRMQWIFGLAETPRVGLGRVPVVLHLLSPAMRPMQVTRDLAAFWRGSYADVRKEMRGRYPRHHWPENPLEAEPIRGVKRKPIG